MSDQDGLTPQKRPAFRRRSNGVVLASDQAKRQSLITHLAFQLLGGRDAAVAFLNAHDDALDARPLDRAMADEAGYAEVEALLRAGTGPGTAAAAGGKP